MNNPPRIAIFADIQNIYYTCRQAHSRQFNYRALWQKISQQGQIVCAYAYAIARHDDKQIKFQDALRNLGFEVKLKPFIQRSDGSAKGDWDVGITIDIMETAPAVDVIILLSGDGDFAILLNHIRSKYPLKSAVYGVKSLTAHALINACDDFHAIDDSLLQ